MDEIARRYREHMQRHHPSSKERKARNCGKIDTEDKKGRLKR